MRVRRATTLAAIAAGLAAACTACSDPAAHVTLAPTNGSCGVVAGATSITVTALRDGSAVTRAVGLDEPVELGDFPADTAQLTVEVLGGSGSAAAIGKTAPLDYSALADGATLPIFMAPPDGFCPAGELAEARIAPLVARAGSGVLVVGGHDAGGDLASAEYYDPATATFSTVGVPEAFADGGFGGAALTALPDGRAALTGGATRAFTIFDPATRSFGDPVLIDARAFHAAIATDAAHVLLAAGCHDVIAGGSGSAGGDDSCGAPTLHSSKLYALADVTTPAVGPTLASAHVGAQLFDLGVQADGTHAFEIAGGVDDTGASPGERFALTDDNATAVGSGFAQAAALDGGGVLTAFAPDGATSPLGSANELVVDGLVRPIASAPPRDGARLITLEDGAVLAIGAADTGTLARYQPGADRWETVLAGGDGPGAIVAPSLVRLADGSVLVLGGYAPVSGSAAPEASPDAWIFRPSLIGPYAASVVATPAADQDVGLVPADPASVTRTAGWQLAVPADVPTDLARAVVGGPRMIDGSVSAEVRVQIGGVALIAQQVSAGQAIVARLTPGAPATITRLGTSAACTGQAVPALDAAVDTTATLELRGGTATLSLDGAALASCDLGDGDRGSWGIAAAGAGAVVTVDAVTVQR